MGDALLGAWFLTSDHLAETPETKLDLRATAEIKARFGLPYEVELESCCGGSPVEDANPRIDTTLAYGVGHQLQHTAAIV